MSGAPRQPSPRRVLVTGAGGFIGRAMVRRLLRDDGVEVVAASRTPVVAVPRVEWFDAHGLGGDLDWAPALRGVEAVVHLAGRAHVLRESEVDPERAFHAINRDATRQLAAAAAGAGVGRFVLLSTVGVHGDRTFADRPFCIDDVPRPYDAYTRSKLAGEAAAFEASAGSKMQVTVLRSPMVYGPNAPGNFSRLVRLVRSGLPLPFGAIRNARSLIFLDFLVEAIHRCIDHPSAPGRRLIVADGDDVSTPDLIRAIALGVGRPARLVPVPEPVLELGLRSVGLGSLHRRLCGSLQVDASASLRLLGVEPVADARTLLREAAHETRP